MLTSAALLMLSLLAPLLAQVVTLGVDNHTEGRYVASIDKRYEASTTPGAQLALVWPHYFAAVRYSPSLTLTPLESTPRDLLVYHHLTLSTAYKLRHAVISLTSDTSFGQINFLVAALQTPTVPGMTDMQNGQKTPDAGQTMDKPTTGAGATTGAGTTTTAPNTTATAGQPQTHVERRAVHYITSNTRLQVSQDVSKEVTVQGFVGYFVAGGATRAERLDYPLIRGKIAGAQATDTVPWTARDSFFGLTSLNQTWSSNGNRVTALLANQGWRHTFSKRASSSVIAGLSVSRFAQDDGLVAYSVFPNFATGISYQTLLARGTFNWGLNLFAQPALDPLRATIDPRVGASSNLGWAKGHFSTTAFGTASISTAPKDANAGAFDTYQASLVDTYRFSQWIALDAGARLARQLFQGVGLIPFSYSFFVGLDLGYDIPLRKGR